MPGHTGASPETLSVYQIVVVSDPGTTFLKMTTTKSRTTRKPGKSGDPGTATARHAVSPDLYHMMEELYYWYDDPQEIIDDIWRLYTLAISPDPLPDRLHILEVSELTDTVMRISDMVNNIMLEVKSAQS